MAEMTWAEAVAEVAGAQQGGDERTAAISLAVSRSIPMRRGRTD